ncbi:DUF354 domain-containing protein [Saliphagus infecundisoli]|uniref:DUF354 domain-containing protein n=1 Tax=Saliphagus infecundisoli TaxID=1849069 RepID=A0ABD5QIE6_9EURY|nr:DUF354 domain-containing protein [Saliphagus infecundisoli]
MKVVLTIQHPAHVHFFRHAIGELEAGDDEVFVFARENDLAVPLLERYGIAHEVLAGPPSSMAGLAAVQATYELRLLRRARAIEPDVMAAIGGVAVAHVAPLVGARSVVFVDNEGVASHRLMAPFADVICTPRRFEGDFGEKHRRYDGYHELAYLHPDRFEPDPDALRERGVEPDDRYFLLRFRRWDALHDVGEAGLSRAGKRRLVSELADRGTVYITSTDPLPDAFEPYRLPVAPERIHDLLYYADLYAGDSATMATEAAVLGTPAVRVQSFAGRDRDMSNFRELAGYGLLRSTPDEDRAIDSALALADAPPGRQSARRDRLLAEKIDVTEFLVSLLRAQNRSGDGRSSHPRPRIRR